MPLAVMNIEKAEDQQPEARRGSAKFIEALSGCVTSYDVFRVLKEVCAAYGCSSFIVMHLPDRTDKSLNDQIMVTNWNPELIRAYDSLGLVSGSPIMSHLRQSPLPFIYNLEEINVDRGDEKDQDAISLFSKFGHLQGGYFPCTDGHGLRGAVGFAGSEVEFADDALADLSYIAIHIYDRLSKIEDDTHMAESQLTERERECLVWTSAGKTSAETGAILTISENTVNHYLSSAAAKLGTANKAHTVAMAIRRGLLKA